MMNRNHVRYAVIILNYNTADDAIKAAQSVIESALGDDYIICIADNGSSKIGEKAVLEAVTSSKIKKYFFEENYGYANGNNKAIECLSQEFDFEYTVIMNPDVCIQSNGTIEQLIMEIEKDDDRIVGGQPLVHTVTWNVPAQWQINIRKVPGNIKGVLVYTNMFARKIWRGICANINYENDKPYVKNILYEVPSGAFFIMKQKIFKEIGYFDSNTFMYCEEIILGLKLKKHNFTLLFVPTLSVAHYHGKSTGSHNGKISDFTCRELIKSWDYYCKSYLKLGNFSRRIVTLAIKVDSSVRNVLWRIKP